METVVCLGIGYLLGSISPAALVSKLKQVDLTKEGTKNLGATNTFLTAGKFLGVLVMVFDVFKAWISARIARRLYPQFLLAGLIASFGAMLGHNFSLFLKFHGGKGLAAFGGLVLAHDPVIFGILLALGIVTMLLVNYGVGLTVAAGVLFPVLAYWRSGDLGILGMSIAASALLLLRHVDNVKRAKNDEDIHVREYLFHKK